MPSLSPLLRWPGKLLSVLLPSSCVLCGALGQQAVCAACSRDYALDVHPRCPCCANPVGSEDGGRRCGACLADPPAFDATVAACDYGAPVDRLVLGLKFGSRLALAPWMAGRLREAVLARSPDPRDLPDLLCPVPLGPRRLVERGYNQALEMARPLSAALGIPLAPRLLERRVETAAQSGVAPGQRRRNVQDAFALADDSAMLQGRHVGVVDDVMTSGHTLDELAGVLKRAGVARVTNLVFARTPPHL
ncbi:ComF family protein [Massilia sp. BSC265]|uniref:ComF family protein n=1 Tax=Massilia sp. BSC265 TaxID=1549812 RepID=UPI0004E865A5|nr:ComF family protein [Massilia sp. BSC265]KFI07080.1 amidophosphoribosyltransferase [Massilia sp. BSC265]